MVNNTIKYFKELSLIPRESKNEKQVCNYLVNFAKEHNFYYYADSYNNVLIKKINNNRKPVILQAHTDMVCVKEQNYDFDFSKNPLKLIEKNNYLSAYKTSLGADNGIGVAIILSLLADNNNYNIEALFTSDEEVTMTGALNFDYSKLNATNLISLDGFNSKQLINGCASICDMIINFNTTFKKENLKGYTITISGLKGGHSGEDINKNIGNAINILADILLSCNDVKLQNIQGGKQFNFIPNYVTCTFFSPNFEAIINKKIKQYKNLYKGILINYTPINTQKTLSQQFSNKILNVLGNIKTGVILQNNNSGEILVSQNLASINLEEGIIKINERAHSYEEENKQINTLKTLAENNGFTFSIFDKQPGLIQNESCLTEELCKINKQVNNENLEVTTKNISFEGAIFKQKNNNFDIAVVSPDIFFVHSTNEKVYLPSITKTYNLLENFLKNQ